MIDVTVYERNRPVACADECPTPEEAMFAARTMWDEHARYRSTQGITNIMSVKFSVLGEAVTWVRGKRP